MIKKTIIFISFAFHFTGTVLLLKISSTWDSLPALIIYSGIAFILTSLLILLYVTMQKKIFFLENESGNDSLTGIPNQKRFRNILYQEIIRAKRYERSLSLIVFDIDDFKKVNSTFGHQTGDKIIKLTAKLIESQIRGMDLIGRWGGEEFFLLLPETNRKHGFFVAERIRHIVEVYKIDKQISVTMSIGLAEMQKDDTVESIIERADQAVYRAKAAGKNRVEFAEDL